ncbi:hypothetical protein RRG08_066703, partial [Elysia crispata]
MAIFIYVFINRWADIKVSSHKIYYQLTFSVNFVTQCFPAVKSTHTRGYAHVTFCTTLMDSADVPHILEHTPAQDLRGQHKEGGSDFHQSLLKGE